MALTKGKRVRLLRRVKSLRIWAKELLFLQRRRHEEVDEMMQSLTGSGFCPFHLRELEPFYYAWPPRGSTDVSDNLVCPRCVAEDYN